MLDIFDLVYDTLYYYYQEFHTGIGKTKLLKLVYLIELFFYRQNRKRLTSAEWVYYRYGPYLFNYDDLLSNMNISIDILNDDPGKNANIISLKDKKEEIKIETDLKFLIKRIVKEYGKQELKDILDFIYFDTEPMINVEYRGEKLNFKTVLPEEYYRIKEINPDKKTRKKYSSEFKKRLEEIRGKHD